MDDIVAVAVELDNRQKRYFMTWGRIQDAVDCGPLEAIVLKNAHRYDLGGVPKSAEVCDSLQEGSQQRYFFEALLRMSRKKIPAGKGYRTWKKKINKLMEHGEELQYLGRPKGP